MRNTFPTVLAEHRGVTTCRENALAHEWKNLRGEGHEVVESKSDVR